MREIPSQVSIVNPMLVGTSRCFNYLGEDRQNCCGPSNGIASGLRLEQTVPMLRQAFTDRLKQAMKAREPCTVSTIRLILAGLKERDVAARERGNAEGLSDAEIRRMLQTMIKQRRESISLYEQGNRGDLAQREREEISVIEDFLPRQLDRADTEAAVVAVIGETGATGIKDMGRVMGMLRERYEGVIDFALAGAAAKRLLG